MNEPKGPEVHVRADDCATPARFLNWQLSQLEFNWRVLVQARDADLPLLERLKFLCLSSTKLDAPEALLPENAETALPGTHGLTAGP